MTIFAHFINNASAVIFYYFYYGGKTDDTMDKLGTPESHAAYAFLSLAVIVVIMLVIRRIMKEKKDAQPKFS